MSNENKNNNNNKYDFFETLSIQIKNSLDENGDLYSNETRSKINTASNIAFKRYNERIKQGKSFLIEEFLIDFLLCLSELDLSIEEFIHCIIIFWGVETMKFLQKECNMKVNAKREL